MATVISSVLQYGTRAILQPPVVRQSILRNDPERKNPSKFQCRSLRFRPMASGKEPYHNLRPAVKGHRPSLWADLSFSFDAQVQERCGEAIEALKEDVKSMVTAKDCKPFEKMILIDTIERLGVAYMFEQEIEEQIEQIYKFQAEDGSDKDLFTTALYFRLFRQHGYNAPSSVFDKFKDEDNKFKKNLIGEIDGLLSLCEASYVRYHGEDVLEEALVFTKHYLNQALPQLDSLLKEKVARALEQPIHRAIEVVEARYFISFYEKDESRNELLLRLAKLNFKLLQNLYRKELGDLTKWWNELRTELPYVRDRLVECYFWGVLIIFEPQYSFSRLATAKAIAMTMVLNDTYDSYGTLEELESFTEILHRWDIKEIDNMDIKEIDNILSENMKRVFHFLLRAYAEHEREASKQGRSYAASYAIEAMKRIARGYHKKAKWYKGQEVPTFEDHMSNGVIVGGTDAIFSATFMNLESVASEEAVDWLKREPTIVVAASLLIRHMNDICTYEREQRTGQFPTAVDCYKIENALSTEEALDKFIEFAEDKWKTINKELVASRTVPRHFTKLALNYARGTYVTYGRGADGFTEPEKGLESDIVALLVDPLII
uniref:Putative terpene synthase 5 n=1 Tax=Eremophila denticulata subsp. trisulcata TaxID=2652520 RepID=A0A6G9KSR2_9LAMI|nr:putative terpene synthase 5 [Eremophila denticulata subsp. trisulcata]